jgi:hypothetical protein
MNNVRIINRLATASMKLASVVLVVAGSSLLPAGVSQAGAIDGTPYKQQAVPHAAATRTVNCSSIEWKTTARSAFRAQQRVVLGAAVRERNQSIQ